MRVGRGHYREVFLEDSKTESDRLEREGAASASRRVNAIAADDGEAANDPPNLYGRWGFLAVRQLPSRTA